MGYSPGQIRELERTINRVPADAVISGTPIDLRGIIKSKKPIVRIRYNLEEIGRPNLNGVITRFIKKPRRRGR